MADTTIDIVARAIAEHVMAILKAEMAKVQERPAVQPLLLSVRDAAVYIGRSEQAVQHIIFNREIPVVRFGRRVHLDRRDLDVWIEKNKY
jgi:excisionase family DNA binding protein